MLGMLEGSVHLQVALDRGCPVRKLLLMLLLFALSQISCIGTTAVAPPDASDTLVTPDNR